MSQRFSGHARTDEWPTPDWVTEALLDRLPDLHGSGYVWEPAAGKGAMANTMKRRGLPVIPTGDNFFERDALPHPDVRSIITNPPYGPSGKTAREFIEHALQFPEVNLVAMLLQVDFDSGSTRSHLFRDEARWAMKVVLLKRIVWFENKNGRSGSSTNHAWYVWKRSSPGSARIAYAG